MFFGPLLCCKRWKGKDVLLDWGDPGFAEANYPKKHSRPVRNLPSEELPLPRNRRGPRGPSLDRPILLASTPPKQSRDTRAKSPVSRAHVQSLVETHNSAEGQAGALRAYKAAFSEGAHEQAIGQEARDSSEKTPKPESPGSGSDDDEESEGEDCAGGRNGERTSTAKPSLLSESAALDSSELHKILTLLDTTDNGAEEETEKINYKRRSIDGSYGKGREAEKVPWSAPPTSRTVPPFRPRALSRIQTLPPASHIENVPRSTFPGSPGFHSRPRTTSGGDMSSNRAAGASKRVSSGPSAFPGVTLRPRATSVERGKSLRRPSDPPSKQTSEEAPDSPSHTKATLRNHVSPEPPSRFLTGTQSEQVSKNRAQSPSRVVSSPRLRSKNPTSPFVRTLKTRSKRPQIIDDA